MDVPGGLAPQIVQWVFDSLRRGRGCFAPAGAAKGRRPLESCSLCKGWRNFCLRFALFSSSLDSIHTKEAPPMPGFIQDKLEIKFLILYIAARVIEPVPFDTILDLTLCDDAIDYFDFSDCLADLVRTEHMTLSDSGLYSLTEKGRRNSAICESSLPYSVRRRCDRNLEEWNRKLRRQRQVKSSVEPRPNGTYTVRLSLNDDKGGVMDLRLMVVDQAQAKAVTKRFQETPEKLYSQILRILLPEES